MRVRMRARSDKDGPVVGSDCEDLNLRSGQGRHTKYIATESRCEPDFSCGRTDQRRSKNSGLIQAKPVSATGGHTLRRVGWYGNGVEPRAASLLAPIRCLRARQEGIQASFAGHFERESGCVSGEARPGGGRRHARRWLRILAGEWHATPACVHLMDMVVFAPMLLSPRIPV